MPAERAGPRAPVWPFLSCMILVKFLMATARRMIFPFAVFVAKHLNTSVSLLSVALAAMRISGMLGLFAAPLLWACCRTGRTRVGRSRCQRMSGSTGAKPVMVFSLALQAISILSSRKHSGAHRQFHGLPKVFRPVRVGIQRVVFKHANVRQRQVAATLRN